MANFTLTAQMPLGGFERQYDGVSLAEAGGLALVSVATPMDGVDALAEAVGAAYGVPLPGVGTSHLSQDGTARVLGLQRDQMFVLFEHDGDGAVAAVADKLGDAGYYTDQTDSWAMLRITGRASRSALERICMLDLHPESFTAGAVARTTMEHLGVIIVRDGENSFLLMSPRSSAKSFLHAIETSIVNVS